MICFPNAKINLGLNVLSKRTDGFHDIESLIYPIPIRDALEFLPADSFQLSVSGFHIDGSAKDNLVYKAWKLLHKNHNLPPLHVHLHKTIPLASGLGGGSSDAAFFIRETNTVFELGLNENEMKNLAGQLGSDCTFFIENKPSLVSGKGEILQRTNISLSGKYLAIVKPSIHVSTPEMYNLIKPKKPQTNLSEIIFKPIRQWKDLLINDFEDPAFRLYPEINDLKKSMYKSGATYVSMSGSGSAIFGIFENKPILTDINPNYYLWTGKL